MSSAKQAGWRIAGIVAAWSLAWMPAHVVTAQTPLRWKFEPGAASDVTISQSTAVIVDYGATTVEWQFQQTLVLRQTVAEVDSDGNATLELQLRRIALKMDGAPERSYDFDSMVRTEPQGTRALLAAAAGALLENKFTCKMTPLGRVMDIVIPKEVVEAVATLKEVPGAGELFSKEGLEQLFRQNTVVFPEGPVTKGDMWSDRQEFSIPSLGKQIVTTQYTSEGQELVQRQTYERLALKTTIAFDEVAPNPAKIKILEQNGQGLVRFDAARGQLRSGQIDQNMKMEVEVGNATVTQRIKSRSTVQVN